MKHSAITIITVLALCSLGLQAQTTATIAGNYMDEKNNAVLSIETQEKGYAVRQISTPVAKDKAMDGQVVAKITSLAGTTANGVVITGGHEYQTTWDIQNGGSIMALKVKAGVFHFNASWKRCAATCP